MPARRKRSEVARADGPPGGRGARVTAVPIATRPLFVLQFGDPLPKHAVAGPIVWFDVPAGTEPTDVAAYSAELERQGAVRARPVRQGSAAPMTAGLASVVAAVALPPRQVVLELVEQVEPAIRDDVRAIVERAMTEAGL